MRKLLSKPRAVAGLDLRKIDEDTRLYEMDGGSFHLRLVEPEGRRRLETQEFIAQAYHRVFRANLQSFYPSLIALHGESPLLCGAAGARYADGQELFLEQYLQSPVERLIENGARAPVQRSSVVEIGSFSVRRPALTYPFISMIGGWLQTYGVEWLVFSLTGTLRHLFTRAGVELLDLGPAQSSRLAQSDNDWGSYYQHDPRVMAARLTSGLDSFHCHYPGFAHMPSNRGRPAPRLIEALSTNQIAIHDGFGSEKSSRAILDRANRVAEALVQDGVACAGLKMDNGPNWLCADLACQIAGVAVVPLPAFFTPAQVEHAARETGMDALIGPLTHRNGHFADFEPRGSELEWWAGRHRERVVPAGVAKVTFTSGTTGTPKGICLSLEQQETLAGSLAAATSGLSLRKHLVALPLAVLLENVAGVYGALLSGADIVMPSLESVGFLGATGFAPAMLLQTLRKHRPHSLILLPQMLKGLVALLKQLKERIEGLRLVSVGGARTAPELILEARELGLPVYEGYGLTEACSVVAVNLPEADRIGTVGQTLTSRRVRIGPDSEIEVYLREGVRYLGQPDVPAGWFPTGDLGRLDGQGFLQVSGRKKQVIVTSFGRNVSPEWVESELLAEASLVQAFVFGDDLPALGALLVAAPGTVEADVQVAVDRCNARMPDYAHIAAWRLVPPFSASAGQLTPNGRVIRISVQESHQELIDALSDEINARFSKEPRMDFYQQLIQQTEPDRRVLLDQPVITECLAGRIELPTYQAFLEQAYHHVKHTVPLLMACGARLPDRLEWLREAVAEYIEEETGHQEWILNDIAACGGDAEAVRRAKPEIATDVMVAYAWDGVLRRNPVSFFGMVLVLEGTSVKLASAAADVIQQQLELPDAAFSYLRSHGSLDEEHLGFYETLVNRLDDPQDRDAVLDTARVMYRLYANIFKSLPRPGNHREAA